MKIVLSRSWYSILVTKGEYLGTCRNDNFSDIQDWW